MSSPIIEVRNLWFSFNGHTALKAVNLMLDAREFTAIIGPNGGGKTTLLKLLLGLLRPDQGTIRIFGKSPGQAAHRIGYVPQEIGFNKNFPISAMDVTLMGTLKSGKGWAGYSKNDRAAAEETLERLGMSEFRDRRIGELSGGQRQKVFIARAIVNEPEILFLDEPTASIDTKGQTEFYNLLRRLNETTTILMVSHDLMIVSSYVSSVACVNQAVHYHNSAEITEEMLDMHCCPVELVTHGKLPHRVLRNHEDF